MIVIFPFLHLGQHNRSCPVNRNIILPQRSRDETEVARLVEAECQLPPLTGRVCLKISPKFIYMEPHFGIHKTRLVNHTYFEGKAVHDITKKNHHPKGRCCILDGPKWNLAQ
jgi:hypothetical protein